MVPSTIAASCNKINVGKHFSEKYAIRQLISPKKIGEGKEYARKKYAGDSVTFPKMAHKE